MKHKKKDSALRLQRKAVKALHWIVAILQKRKVPYQISGGLAAKFYGARRPLIDIDIDIPDEHFRNVLADVRKYVIFGPKNWRGEGFKVYLLTLNYKGQLIDIGGTEQTQIWNRKKQRWIRLGTDFENFMSKKIARRIIKVVPLEELVEYKSILDRRVDKSDLKDIVKRP